MFRHECTGAEGGDSIDRATACASTASDASTRPAVPLVPLVPPADVLPWRTPSFLPLRLSTAVWLFVALGVVARCVRFVLRFPLWEDECFLVSNYIDRGYAALLQPLDYHQVAPPLFMWMELAATRWLGFNEWSLRLVPLAASIGSLLLFRALAVRLLRGTSLLLAVATFAVAYPCIRYAAEAKPYGCDLLASLVLIYLLVRWWQAPGERRWLWALAVAVPVAVGLSYPVVFVAGGVSVIVLLQLAGGALRRARSSGASASGATRATSVPGGLGSGLAWGVYNVALVASFAAVYFGCAVNQSQASLETMQGFWTWTFPPVESPLRLLGWAASIHAGDMLSYPVGGPNWGSSFTLLLCTAALVLLVRERQWGWLLLLGAPLGLNFVAAALHRFPYGGHMRFALYLAPLFCLLAGLGASVLLAALVRRRPEAMRWVWGATAVLALLAVASISRDFARPYKTQSDMRARDFARWFWFNGAHEGELASLRTDLGLELVPHSRESLTWLAMFYVNQRIYSPRHARGEPLRLERVSVEWPLRCVDYRATALAYDQATLEAWLAEMQVHYRLEAKETFPFPRYDKRERSLETVDYVDVYRFVPLGDVAQQLPGARDIDRRRTSARATPGTLQ